MKTLRGPHQGRIVIALLLLLPNCALRSWAAAFPDWTDCPTACRCKWTSGKKSALCPDAGLTSLPKSLDPDMQVLDLSGNRIAALEPEVFKLANLLNLQRVFLRNAGLLDIDGDAFKEMRILVEVDLSDNHLRSLETHTFAGNERLKLLILSGNPLRSLDSNQFPMLQHLKNLELRRCSLVWVHSQAFQGLPALETLSLNNNELEYLEPETITGLKRLKTLGLDNNLWSCDCRLREFCKLLSSGFLSRLYSMPQTCVGPPRLRGRTWDEIRPMEFACEPTVELPVSSIQEEKNGNLSIACLASGDPEPEVWWQLNGEPLNGTKHSLDDLKTPEARSQLMERWYNLTIYNASDANAGEYTCHARNLAGTVRKTISVSIPRVFMDPNISQTNNWTLWVSLVGGGTVALSASVSAALLGLCIYGSARRRSHSAKVKLQGSTSFGDQEKKLLHLSATTTTTNVSGQQQPHKSRGQGPGALRTLPKLEPEVRASGPEASVTVERSRLGQEPSFPQGNRCLSPGFPVGIFIAVSLSSEDKGPSVEGHQRCYPDLLDIGRSTFASLPRRPFGRRELGSPYDNMGPRVTVTGSSTFSLLEQPEPVPLLRPPSEFVSL